MSDDAIGEKVNSAENTIGTWISKGSDHVNVVVAGRKESGKTALASALCDVPVPQEDPPSVKLLVNRRNSISAATGNIVVWDTCGMCEGYDGWKSDVAVRQLKSLQCLKVEQAAKTVLLYCVRVDQSHSFEDINSDLDFKCMKRLTSELGEFIWRNSVIVFTFVNGSFEENKDTLTGADEESKKKSYYDQVLAKTTTELRSFISAELLNENKAKSIPMVPAGFRRNSTEPASLNCDSTGDSWILNLWQQILGVAPMNCQPLLWNYWFECLYKSSFFYTDSFLSLMKLHGSLYLKKADLAEGDEKISWAFSFLRIIKIWFSNIDKFRLQQEKSSTEKEPAIEFWRSLQAQVDIKVTGAQESGKTSLINSLLYEKCQIQEVNNNSGTWSTQSSSNITCKFTEIPLEQIAESDLDKTALLLVCVRLEDSEEDVARCLEPVVSKNPKNVMIVLTFSNVNFSETPWKELVDTKTEAIKRVLKEDFKIADQVVENLKVVPASYYTEKSIQEDPEAKPWIMNVWLNSIASASLTTQSAMAVFVNYSHYGKKKISAHHKSFFLRNMYKIVADMLATHCTSYEAL